MLYGPGKRVVIWVKGFFLKCEGCTNLHLWEREGGKDITATDLAALCLKDGIDGITLHGGEPTEQHEELLPAINAIHEAWKTVILFTGYEIQELISDKQKEFLSCCDLIICVRFEIAKLNRRLHFRGSDTSG
ncbi:MAG: radical SAM protein [Christensenellaceae bacterium]|nr:radical SAM protein [Christensenellaceae bacterium]